MSSLKQAKLKTAEHTTDEDVLARKINLVNRDRWVAYPRAVYLLEEVQELVDYPRIDRMPSILIHGKSGMGKTMLAKKILRDHRPGYDDVEGRSIYQVVYVEIPPAPVPEDLYFEIMSSIGGVLPRSLRGAQARDVTLRTLKNVGCKVLLLDEIHNMLSGSAREQRLFLNLLRYITNKNQVSLVSFGIDSAERALSQDKQLASRFETYPLLKIKEKQLSKFVVSYLRSIHVPYESSKLDDDCYREIITKTSGIIGNIVKLLKRSAIFAIRHDVNEISYEIIKNIKTHDTIESSKAYRKLHS